MGVIRRYFIAGLLVWLPLGVTVLVIKLLVDLLDQVLLFIPAPYRPDALLGFHIPGLGVVLSIALVFATGVIVANLFGRQLVALWEAFVDRIPLVNTIYSAVKQLLETLLSPNGTSFRKVLLIEYPRKGLWTLAFQTSETLGEVQDKTSVDVITVFVPTTPNPTSGFIIMVPRNEVIELSMSVDQGLKMIISLGVVVPKPPLQPNSTSSSASPVGDQ